jgi:hypothetical protein
VEYRVNELPEYGQTPIACQNFLITARISVLFPSPPPAQEPGSSVLLADHVTNGREVEASEQPSGWSGLL